MIKSPFQSQKWEYSDTEPIIWIPSKFHELEEQKNIYLSGIRGCGKTTLLMSLEWKLRIKNQSIQDQLEGHHPLSKKYIGLYLSSPDIIGDVFNDWNPKKGHRSALKNEISRAQYYSLFIEYEILQLLIGALEGLYEKNILSYSLNDEISVAKKILRQRNEIEKHFSTETEKVLLGDIKAYFQVQHEKIRYYASNCVPVANYDDFPSLQMGELLQQITPILLELCEKDNVHNDDATWSIKICIDQAESFSHYQQKVLNTILVVTSRCKCISFVIASLEGGIDINSTYIPRHSLTDADRTHFPFEKIYELPGKFDEFVTNVASLRIKYEFKINNVQLNLKKILGEWSLNELLDSKLRYSQNQKVKQFIIRSKEFKENIRKLKTSSHQNSRYSSIDDDIPSYYETYIFEKLNYQLPTEYSEYRRFSSNRLRKRNVAAALCLCKEFNQSFPYAGYNILIDMSDNCIRHFLKQMNEIYLNESKQPEIFIKSHVSIANQNAALTRASDLLYKGIGELGGRYPTEVTNLIEAVARLTAMLQTQYKNLSGLTTPERGIFEVDLSKIESIKEREELAEIFLIARDNLFINVIGSTEDDISTKKIEFRIVSLFAPKFGFSYREPLYTVKIDANLLLKICKEKDGDIRKEIIDSIMKTGKLR